MGNTLTPTEFIRNATRVARHYGFEQLETVAEAFQDIKKDVSAPEKVLQLPRIPASERRLDALSGVLTTGISSYIEHDLQGSSRPVLFSTVESLPRTGELAVGLHAIGIGKSIAEALLIHTLRALLAELGFATHTVKINSIGDRDSLNRYVRELNNFLRKRIEEVPPIARELMKQHVFQALLHLVEKDHDLSYRMPSPLEYLSDQSRRSFRELVEYLDTSEALYEIDTRLLGHHQCYSDALFSIEPRSETGEESSLIVRGGRYDEFVKRLTKASVPAVGAVVIYRGKRTPSRLPRMEAPADPGVFLVQLGFGPKLRSLALLEELRTSNICVNHNLSSDSLNEQLRHAESLRVPIALILGQKEFVDKTIIVRDMRSRSQESVPLPSLTSHLKRALRG
jgi:histidyl-tRNA synthetase